MSLSYYFSDPSFSLSEFGHLFDEHWEDRLSHSKGQRSIESKLIRPKMDIHESADNNLVTATFELPGLTKENINIEAANNRLMISGEASAGSDTKQDSYTVRERKYGKFSRTLPLPPGTKPEVIKASMEHGVLNVTFPKTQPEAAIKKIAIN